MSTLAKDFATRAIAAVFLGILAGLVIQFFNLPVFSVLAVLYIVVMFEWLTRRR